MLWRCDLSAQYEKYRTEIDRAIAGVLASGKYVLAENVAAFENEFAKYVGVEHAVGVNSGTDALILAMWAAGVRPGDEVITTPFTAIPTYSAIRQVGAVPIFIEIDPHSWLMDLNKVKNAITTKTKAVVAVHIFGNPLDVEELRNVVGPKIAIIEDCAQSHGAKVRGRQTGGLGDIAAFSFYPTKNLGGYGDGGMVTTRRADWAEALRKRRMYGMISKDEFITDGVNTRLDEIQAAILRVKLGHLNEMNQQRERLMLAYAEHLPRQLQLQMVGKGCESVHHVLSATCDSRRDELMRYLDENSIQTNVYYPMPLSQQKGYLEAGLRNFNLPVTEDVCRRIIALPFYPELPVATAVEVAQKIRAFYA